MNYKDMMKKFAPKPVQTSNVNLSSESEDVMKLKQTLEETIEKLKTETASMETARKDYQRMLEELRQTEVEESESREETLRTDDEVEFICSIISRFSTEYFPDIPLGGVAKKFIYNIPTNVFDAITFIENSPYSDIFNPAMYLFILMVDDPLEASGRYCEILRGIMDDNAQAIRDDAYQFTHSFDDTPDSAYDTYSDEVVDVPEDDMKEE